MWEWPQGVGYTSQSHTRLKNQSREFWKAEPASVIIQYRIPSGPGDLLGRADSLLSTTLSSAGEKGSSEAGSLAGCARSVGIAAWISSWNR